jgi:hypothetical protein
MKTITNRNAIALLFVAAAITTLAGNAFAKGGKNGPTPSLERPEIGVAKRPILKFKQNDLAATNLITTFEGDPTQGTAKLIMVGTCKNLGMKAYQPGVRTVRIEKKVGNAWITQHAKTLPALAAGKSFSLSMDVKPNDKGEYRLEVTAGGPADENPGNDIFVPGTEPVDPPK